MARLKWLFDRNFRRARAAEGAGDYREAAKLYAQGNHPAEAANALLFHATRAKGLEERLNAYQDALRWLPEGHQRRAEVQAKLGLAVLDEAQRAGARTRGEKRRLSEAAEMLVAAGQPSKAATAYELLGRTDEVARCLEMAGEVERLEDLLESIQAQAQREHRLARLLSDYEMAMRVGARLEARRSLREAIDLAPHDPLASETLRRLEHRMPRPYRVELDVAGRPITFVGVLPAVFGRTGADVVVRGASVSRRHAELASREGKLYLRDLGSRNGTLIGGVPLGSELELRGETEVGLGDDVTLRIGLMGRGGLLLEVISGLDVGARTVLGAGKMGVPALPACVSFPDGHATLEAQAGTTLELGTQKCAVPIVLLVEDQITLDGHRIEVRP